jgi:hypothetical protein
LAWAVAPTSLEPGLLLEALKSDEEVLVKLPMAMGANAQGGWEQDLFAALALPRGPVRDALVGEQLMDLHERADRWARVPRVCASVSTSTGFLFASITLIRGLAAPASDAETTAVYAALTSALDALAIGICGASFCAAVHLRARRFLAGRLAATDRLMKAFL